MPTTRPTRLRSGALLQSGIPKVPKMPPGPSHGLMRAVVLATYVTDDPSHPMLKYNLQPTSVFCDCLCFQTQDGPSRYFFLPAVQVCQPFGGMHKGAVHKPRATSKLLTDKPLSAITPVDVSAMDGDHVLIQFIEGHINQPIIVGYLPHPARDVGNDPTLPAGQRQQLRLIDGDPQFWLHHGSRFGIDTSGNFLVDTTRANDGTLTPQSGDAPNAPGQGNISLQVPFTASIEQVISSPAPTSDPPASTVLELSLGQLTLSTGPSTPKFSVESTAGPSLDVEGAGAAAIAKIGSATSPVALADALAAFWSTVQTAFALHVHSPPVPGSPAFTGPPISGLPAYAAAITGASLRIPS